MLSRRVLIIEDDADAAGVLEAYLRRENYDVVITGDEEARLLNLKKVIVRSMRFCR